MRLFIGCMLWLVTLASCVTVNINVNPTIGDCGDRAVERMISEDATEIEIQGNICDISEFKVRDMDKYYLLNKGYKMHVDRGSNLVTFVHPDFY